ncbi:MAG: class I SAM-dependent methyltransferase [Spirochaetes bacterium]|nr:class I SAM-dependent methyltransferase [Spirochaetota bacterium]
MIGTMINDVTDTAFMVATHRANETRRTDALFQDPLAELLAGDHGKKAARDHPKSPMVQWLVTIRTVIIDNFIQTSLPLGIDTVLNLGAGLDTRPYRLDLPKSLRWIEVDYPSIISYKETRLAKEKPRCALERVTLDLADTAERRKFFSKINSSSRGILVLTEGVIPYLTNEDAGSLADDLRQMGNLRLWIVDYSSPRMSRYRRAGSSREYMRNAPFKFHPDDWFGFFGSHGWRMKDIRYLAIESRKLNRAIPLSAPWKVLIIIRALFMSRSRRESLGKFAGYALMEPK